MQRKRGLEIGRPLGFPLLVHKSWLPAGALLVAHLTISAYGGHDLPAAILLSIATALVFFACVAVKGLVQAVVAAAARVPFAGLTVHIFGGIPRLSRDAHPMKDILIGASGPLVSGAVGAFALTTSTNVRGIPAAVLWTLGLANLALAAANLLPALPLDGGRILQAVLQMRGTAKRRAEVTAAQVGQVLGLVAVIAGVWLALAGIATVQDTATGLWLCIAGLAVATYAARAHRAASIVSRLDSASVGAWTKPFAGRVSIDEMTPRSAGVYAVADHGRLAGVVAGRREGIRVRDAMIPWRKDIAVRADEPLTHALERLARGPVVVVVDERGVARGIVDDNAVRTKLKR